MRLVELWNLKIVSFYYFPLKKDKLHLVEKCNSSTKHASDYRQFLEDKIPAVPRLGAFKALNSEPLPLNTVKLIDAPRILAAFIYP